MKFYQYQNIKMVQSEHWQYIFAIHHNSWKITERNCYEKKIDTFVWNDEEYDCAEDAILEEYFVTEINYKPVG